MLYLSCRALLLAMKFPVASDVSSVRSPQAWSPESRQGSSFGEWYAQGDRWATDGAYDRALGCFEAAAILAPEDVEALIYQAVCLIHLERPQRALAVAEQVLAIAPEHPQGWLYRGVALHRLGRYKEAYASYAQVQSSSVN